MNADALSDLVLLLVCGAVVWFHLRQRPALAIAAGLIGLAAALGVLRYSGWAEMLGPHRFASLLAACAAFPLLAATLRWPDAPLAKRASAAGRFVLVVGGLGIALTLSGVSLWRDVVPGVSALVIVWTVVQQRSTTGIVGALLLVGSFVVAATGKPDTQYLGLFNSTQALHYLLAAGLGLLTLRAPR
ncbi:MAG: hypothetical protein H7Y28_13570 [Rhodoferax sp.]|nr:hypothetical protein [Rhodoferax sp.]